MVEFSKYITEYNGKKYTIEAEEFTDDNTHEKMIWYYVYAWTNKGAEFDYLQDTLDMAKKCALDEFGIPVDSWKELKENEHTFYGKKYSSEHYICRVPPLTIMGILCHASLRVA